MRSISTIPSTHQSWNLEKSWYWLSIWIQNVSILFWKFKNYGDVHIRKTHAIFSFTLLRSNIVWRVVTSCWAQSWPHSNIADCQGSIRTQFLLQRIHIVMHNQWQYTTLQCSRTCTELGYKQAQPLTPSVPSDISNCLKP